MTRVAVTSRSFSRNPVLRAALSERYDNVTFNDEGLSLKGAALVDYLAGHDRAITALERIDDALLSQLPDLKVIGKYGVGIDMIDLAALHRHGVSFGWTGGVNKRSVSELVISYAIALLRHVPAAHREVLDGTWRQHVGRQLSGKTVGIIGCGHVGKDLVGMLKPFGCRVLANDILDFPDFYAANDVSPVALDDLLQQADVVTLHTPLDDSTRNLMSAEKIGLMKPDAVLINLARGSIIDENALKSALMNGRLGAAGLDVFSTEPPEDKELLALPNFLVSPHIGGSAEEAIHAMGMAAINGLDNAVVPGPSGRLDKAC